MATFMIGYDLNNPGQNYGSLSKAIQSLSGIWWHDLDSTWLVVHPGPASTIRDALKAHLDSNDKLLVTEVMKGSWASWGCGKEAVEWLHNNA